jgi:hypothetical protein
MKIEFTNAERILFNMTYEFAINVEKLSEKEAREKAMNKILNKRALAKKLTFKY